MVGAVTRKSFDEKWMFSHAMELDRLSQKVSCSPWAPECQRLGRNKCSRRIQENIYVWHEKQQQQWNKHTNKASSRVRVFLVKCHKKIRKDNSWDLVTGFRDIFRSRCFSRELMNSSNVLETKAWRGSLQREEEIQRDSVDSRWTKIGKQLIREDDTDWKLRQMN